MLCLSREARNVCLACTILAATLLIQVIFYGSFMQKLPPAVMTAPAEASKDVIDLLKGYTENLSNIAMAVLGATMATLAAIGKKGPLSIRVVVLCSITLGFAAGSTFFGQQCILALLMLIAETGKFAIIDGPVDLTAKMQFYTLMLALAPLAILLFYGVQLVEVKLEGKSE